MPLSPEGIALVREAVKVAGDELQGKLRPKPWLPTRNPYAHLYERIKTKMGKSYKDCDDGQLAYIIDLIDYYRQHPC
tara:strand:- start:10568 stop:10798 length:231 start_codon:yes stop_codon:yes gene_type:complete